MSQVPCSLADQPSPVTNITADGCEIFAVTSTAELEALRSFWTQTNRHPEADIDFFLFIVKLRPEVERPFVLAMVENKQLKALLIGRLETSTLEVKLGYLTLCKMPLRQLTFVKDALIGDVSSKAARAMVLKVLDFLKAKSADQAVFYHADTASDLYGFVKSSPGVLFRDYASVVAPHWTMKLPATFEEFLASKSKKQRWWLRNVLKTIKKDHDDQVRCRVFQSKDEVEPFCLDAEKVAKKTYQRGLGVGFMNSHEDKQWLAVTAEKGWLRAYILYVRDEPVAFWCGFEYRKTWYSAWTGYDPAYQSYNAGTVVLLEMVGEMVQRGIHTVDFGFGPAVYKERFGDNCRNESCVRIYSPTFKGLTANAAQTVNATLTHLARAVVGKSKFLGRLKAYWRGKLSKADPT